MNREKFDTVNVGVIGLGNMGRHHARNYAEISGCRLHSVYDTHDEKTQKAAQQYSCKACQSLEEMLSDPSLDAVSITSPTNTHFHIGSKAIQHGCHLLIEKPIADSLADADQLILAAEKQGVMIMVGHIERFNPAVIQLKQLIDQQILGTVVTLSALRAGIFPTQIKDANVIIDLAVHDIDIFSFLLGKQPQKILGSAKNSVSSTRVDHAEILLDYGNQTGVVQVNWITPKKLRQLSVTGSKGYAELNYVTQTLDLYRSKFTIENSHDSESIQLQWGQKEGVPVEKEEPLKHELSHFINCIRSKTQPTISGIDGKNALKTALAIPQEIKK